MNAPSRCPDVGLVPYAEEDWRFFFDREAETERIVANLTASRLTLLFGASGVGKSSVLRAGVGHALAERARRNRATGGAPEVVFVVFSAWRDEPLTGLLRAVSAGVARASARSAAEPPHPGRLADAFAAWAAQVGGDILVVLDQFEEYFLYHATEHGEGTLAVELPQLLRTSGLRTNSMISILDDTVSRLDRFKGRIPNLFDNYPRLQHLTLETATDAVRMPLDAFNRANPGERVAIEDALVTAAIQQTRRDSVLTVRSATVLGAAGTAAPEVETPCLQMVLAQVWDEEARRGSRVLRAATLIDPPPAGLGGADRIVRMHLDSELAKLSPGERDVAAEALRFLVTRAGAKIALGAEDIAGPGLPENAGAVVLDKLAAGDRRILRRVPVLDRTDIVRHEIFHDVLGPVITGWRQRHVAIKEQAALRERYAKLVSVGAVCS